MSMREVKDDLIAIVNAVTNVLQGCNENLITPAQALNELPPKVEQTRSESYSNGRDRGRVELLAAYQENGNRTNYNTGFAGVGWTQEIYEELPYPVTVEMGWYGFGYSKIKYLNNVSFVQHKGLATMACCYGCDELLEVGDFDLYYDSDARNFFYNCKKLKKINRFVFPSAEYLTAGFHTNIFANCVALEDITVDGEIAGYDVSFQWCPLSVASMKSVISCLRNMMAGENEPLQTTLTFSEECWAALNADSVSPEAGATWREYVQYYLGWNT